MSAKLWQGRFSKEVDQTVNELNASILFDCRLYPQDIQGSLVHSEMLARQGIITPEDKEVIHQGLQEIKAAMDAGEVPFTLQYEDIHTAVEQLLTEKTPAGKKLHTGRSRNDQVALDLRLYARKEIGEIQQRLLALIQVLTDTARQYTTAVMPGYTHLQRAQPITFAHALLAYAQMFRRDWQRLENTKTLMNECPLGAGALAGTTYPLDREWTSEQLGFARPMANSMDAVSDRDYVIETLSDLSILMMHLSRLGEEMILWSSWEFKFIELDDACSTGSSIMPQKKNPDICELVRGKTGRIYGHLMGLLTTLKGLPLAYNKDMQEDKEGFFDAVDTLKTCLEVFPLMIETMTVLTDNMERAGQKGFINATDCADYLTRKGMSFRDAYKLTGQLVSSCIERNCTLNEVSLEDLQQKSPLFGPDFYEAIDLQTCVQKRDILGGPAPAQTKKQIAELEAFVHAHSEDLH